MTYEIGFKAVEILHNEFSQLLSQPRSICFFSGKLIHPVTHCVMDILPVATTPCTVVGSWEVILVSSVDQQVTIIVEQ